VDGGDHGELGFDGGISRFVEEDELAGIFAGAEDAGEVVDVEKVGRGSQTERG
jgi:hypothetical protein